MRVQGDHGPPKGRLTISGVSIEGRTAAGRPRLVAILPRGLTATLVRSQGLAVVIGSNRRGVARVQLLQGRGRTPRATLTTRLRVPGPTRVVLRSAVVQPGPYRVRITIGRTRLVRRGTLLP